jgi:hypothetical protein
VSGETQTSEADGFKKSFGVQPSTGAENKARASAEEAIERLRRCQKKAQEIIVRQDDEAREEHPLDACGADADGLADRAGDVPKVPGSKDRKNAYARIAREATSAAERDERTIKEALEALAAKLKGDVASLDKAEQLKHLKATAQDPGGRHIMDAMVASLGGKARDAGEKTLVENAMLARFNMESVTGMTKKAGPRIYELMTRVPDSHTYDNERLRNIKRVQNVIPKSSDYAGGTLNLRCGRAGALGVGFNPMKNISGMGTVNHFDHTTLHEVGHSIEHKFAFKAFAGWEDTGDKDVIDAIVNAKGLGTMQGYPEDFLREYAAFLVRKNDGPENSAQLKGAWEQAKATKDSGINRDELLADRGLAEVRRIMAIGDQTQRQRELRAFQQDKGGSTFGGNKAKVADAVYLTVRSNPGISAADAVDQTLARLRPAAGTLPEKPDYAALNRHAAVVWFRSVALAPGSTDKGLWDKGDSAANSAAVGGRVIQESYANQWVSYDPTKRAARVSNYQFRAPSEWFAELYGVYYLGKLPKTHTHYDWFKNTVDK